MDGETWWRPRFGDSRREEEGDACLFALLSRGKLLRSLPPGAERALPVVGAALEAILAGRADATAGPEEEREAALASPEGVAPRTGNPFPSFPPAGDAVPPGLFGL